MYDSLVQLMENSRLEKEPSKYDKLTQLYSFGREIYQTNKQDYFDLRLYFLYNFVYKIP